METCHIGRIPERVNIITGSFVKTNIIEIRREIIFNGKYWSDIRTFRNYPIFPSNGWLHLGKR